MSTMSVLLTVLIRGTISVDVQSISNANFGPLIAYLVPGATALWGFSRFSAPLRSWFAFTEVDAPTISGFLYLTVASLADGMTVTAIRWAFVDLLHAKTGLRPPSLDFARLGGRVDAFNLLIEIHYRHYQFYANMFVATAIAFVCQRSAISVGRGLGWLDVGFVIFEVVFFFTSRDTLRKYYQRTRQLLAEPQVSESAMSKR
jgi:hypothetical protein